MAIVVAGLVVIGLGVLLVLVGVYFAWGEFQQKQELGPSKFIEALAELVKALAGQPKSLICLTFGTLLIFLGGVVAGVAGLTA